MLTVYVHKFLSNQSFSVIQNLDDGMRLMFLKTLPSTGLMLFYTKFNQTIKINVSISKSVRRKQAFTF